MDWLDLFISKNVFLAHCWSSSTGSSRYSHLKIEQKIEKVISGIPEICCSTIKPGDTIHFDSLSGPCNFFGPIGIIIKPGIITHANSDDAGTSQNKNGYRTNNSEEIDINALENAIINRCNSKYNEICIRKYKCIGLFYCVDDFSFLNDVINNCCNFYFITKDYKLKYYKLKQGNLYEVEFQNNIGFFETQKKNTSITELYKTR